MTRADRIKRDLAKARRVLKKVRPKWRRRVGVVDVGVGLKLVDGGATEAVAIHVYVSAKVEPAALRPNQRFPKEVGGVLVDVIQATGRRSQGAAIQSGQHVVANDPTSIDFGTIGLVLRRQNDPTNWFLTCGHLAPPAVAMFLHESSGGVGVPTIGSVPRNTATRINRRLNPRHDWAAIRSAVDPGLVRGGFQGAPRPYQVESAQIGDPVFRVSGTGQKVVGLVTGLEVPIDIGGDDNVAMIQVAAPLGQPPFSNPGDSGAMLLRDAGAGTDLIGVIFAIFYGPGNANLASAAGGLDEIDDELQIDFANT
jgi:hypothetical protein